MKTFLATVIIVLAASAPLNAQTTQPQATIKRGNALVAQEKYREAIAEYEKVSTRDVDAYAQAIYNIGVCHYELWQTEAAIIFYQRAIELKQGNYPRASYALGIALQDQGQLGEARAAYEQAIRVSHREFAAAIYALGLLAARAGEFKQAAELFREAAAREGLHVPASRNNLGVMLANLGLLNEAEKEFAIALKESHGMLDDAARNLNLCRSLLATASQTFSAFVLVDFAKVNKQEAQKAQPIW